MSKEKHTAGPWKILPEEAGRNYIRVRGTRLGETYKIANVVTPNWEGFPDAELEEARANARLIAAAPMLLAELKHLARLVGAALENGVTIPGLATVNGADAAIALAEGGVK